MKRTVTSVSLLNVYDNEWKLLQVDWQCQKDSVTDSIPLKNTQTYLSEIDVFTGNCNQTAAVPWALVPWYNDVTAPGYWVSTLDCISKQWIGTNQRDHFKGSFVKLCSGFVVPMQRQLHVETLLFCKTLGKAYVINASSLSRGIRGQAPWFFLRVLIILNKYPILAFLKYSTSLFYWVWLFSYL